MEQFRQIGETLGSLKALMVFQDNIQINNRQCCLLLDILSFAFELIAEEMKENLRFEEKHITWKILEHPLRELHTVFKEGESYIRQCLETKDWWVKAVFLYQNRDCVEFYIHNLLICITIAMDAIEMAGELSCNSQEELEKKRRVNSRKYEKECRDPDIFHWKYGKKYLVSQDFCSRFENAWKEDRWSLLDKIKEKKCLSSGSTKQEKRLVHLLLKNLDCAGSDPLNGKLLPSSILVGSKDYLVRRRLGGGSQYKEILWLGESFAARHFLGNIEPLVPEISNLLSISHPNILHYYCGFTDEEKKECFLVMELMSRDLSSYIKEICGPRKRLPFSLAVAVDLMLQIARGMEYLHSKKIYHGHLNPSKIFVKPRGGSTDGYLQAKISGFGLSSVKNIKQKSTSMGNNNEILPFIWHAPEVLEEQEQTGDAVNSKHTEKADVYSFGMVCFELLTGKVPFEDGHLQGDKMSRNIRAGERPLFPYHSPKYITNLTKKCWHTDPDHRPSFSSICRILRYAKRFLVINPDYNTQQEPPTPQVDYCDIDSKLQKRFPSWQTSDVSSSVSNIPFQMFSYRVTEKERSDASPKDTSEFESDKASLSGDENITPIEDQFPVPSEKRLSATPAAFITRSRSLTVKRLSSSAGDFIRRLSMPKKVSEFKSPKVPGTPNGRSSRPPPITPCGQSIRSNSEGQLLGLNSSRLRRTASGHASD